MFINKKKYKELTERIVELENQNQSLLRMGRFYCDKMIELLGKYNKLKNAYGNLNESYTEAKINEVVNQFAAKHRMRQNVAPAQSTVVENSEDKRIIIILYK